MKIKLYLVPVIMLLICPSLVSEELRVGFVDFRKVVEQSRIHKQIKAHSEMLNKRFREYEKEQYAKINYLPIAQQIETRNRVNEKRYNLSLAVKINQNKLLAYNETIRTKIREIAHEHRINLVYLNQDMVILISDYIDITEEVIETINQES